jgi:hypothetical protein
MKTFFYTNHICADSAKVNQVVFALIAKVLPPPPYLQILTRGIKVHPPGKRTVKNDDGAHSTVRTVV